MLPFLAGCTISIPDYQPASPPLTERTGQASGVEVALDPFIERERTEKYFDIDAVAKGIAILHVRVVNKTADQTFLVRKDNFQLVPNETAVGLTTDGKQVKPSEPVVGQIPGERGPTPGIYSLFGGTGKELLPSEIRRNFVGKEMVDQTLSAGQSMEGFIYFSSVEKGEDWSGTTSVDVSLTEIKTHQVKEFTIPLSH